MRPFRLPLLWRAIGWLMVGVVAVLLVAPSVPDPLDVAQADKLYHIGGFALLAGWAALLYESPRMLLLRGALLAAFGIGMEGVQAALPWRSAEWTDLAANLTGILLGLALALTPAARWLWLIERRFIRVDSASR